MKVDRLLRWDWPATAAALQAKIIPVDHDVCYRRALLANNLLSAVYSGQSMSVRKTDTEAMAICNERVVTLGPGFVQGSSAYLHQSRLTLDHMAGIFSQDVQKNGMLQLCSVLHLPDLAHWSTSLRGIEIGIKPAC